MYADQSTKKIEKRRMSCSESWDCKVTKGREGWFDGVRVREKGRGREGAGGRN